MNNLALRYCPICGMKYDGKYHKMVRYHVSYRPEQVIFACSECNNIEYLERHGLLWDIVRAIKALRKSKN